jgi:alpha-N-acetylglucosamine transferase
MIMLPSVMSPSRKSIVACGTLFIFLCSLLFYFQSDIIVTRPSTISHPDWFHSQPQYAYSTFLSTRVTNETEDDPYFTATRVLAYQILHQPNTRTRKNIPFLVLVPPHVSLHKRQILTEEGAIVIPVDPLIPQAWEVSPGQTRWIDQFTKLRLFELTQYDRILYMDNDMLLTRTLDDIWVEPEVAQLRDSKNATEHTQSDEAPFPEQYLIAGVTDNEGAGQHHPVPITPQSRLNGGFFVLKPCDILFAYYKSVLEQRDRFDAGFMEMGLLNYAHRFEGNMPWTPLTPGKWSSNWPAVKDMEEGSATLHDKFWEAGNAGWIERKLVEMWWRVQGQMEGYYLAMSEGKGIPAV